MSLGGLVLFDPAGTAHSRNVLQGLADAAGDLPLTILSPEAPEIAAGRPVSWRRCATAALLSRTADRRDYRRAFVDAVRRTPSDAAFCDLGLGRTLTSRGPRIELSRPTVCVAHQSNALDPRPGVGRRELAANRRVLRRLVRQGARFVAHTERMRSRLLEYTTADRVTVSGWPVVAASDPCLGPTWNPQPDDVTVLFAGSARAEKGLPELVEAIPRVDGVDRVLVSGRLGPAVRGLPETSDPRLVFEDRFLDAAEYRDRFVRSVLSVLPYRRSYVDHGIFSSVLAESMAYGRPMVVSEHLAGLLPPDYAGAVVAGPGPEGIARAIREALDRLPELTRAAMTAGRAYAAERFTYERYLRAISELVG